MDVEPADGAGEQVTVEVPIAAAENAQREPAVAGDRPELTQASVVVARGRGVWREKVPCGARYSLDGAVGASRAAVDFDYDSGQFRVGQSAETVSPQRYIALGTSGAAQHRAGMQALKTIVAVNKGEEGPGL